MWSTCTRTCSPACSARRSRPGSRCSSPPRSWTGCPRSVPTIGVRVEASGSALAYSADTGPTEELMPLAREAGLLIADASWQDDGDDARPPIHMTAREAAETAAGAGGENPVPAHLP